MEFATRRSWARAAAPRSARPPFSRAKDFIREIRPFVRFVIMVSTPNGLPQGSNKLTSCTCLSPAYLNRRQYCHVLAQADEGDESPTINLVGRAWYTTRRAVAASIRRNI